MRIYMTYRPSLQHTANCCISDLLVCEKLPWNTWLKPTIIIYYLLVSVGHEFAQRKQIQHVGGFNWKTGSYKWNNMGVAFTHVSDTRCWCQPLAQLELSTRTFTRDLSMSPGIFMNGDWAPSARVLREKARQKPQPFYDLASSSHTASFPQTTLIGTFISLCLDSRNTVISTGQGYFWLKRREELVLWKGSLSSSEVMSNVLF